MQFLDNNVKEIKYSAHAYWSIAKKREPERERERGRERELEERAL